MAGLATALAGQLAGHAMAACAVLTLSLCFVATYATLPMAPSVEGQRVWKVASSAMALAAALGFLKVAGGAEFGIVLMRLVVVGHHAALRARRVDPNDILLPAHEPRHFGKLGDLRLLRAIVTTAAEDRPCREFVLLLVHMACYATGVGNVL